MTTQAQDGEKISDYFVLYYRNFCDETIHWYQGMLVYLNIKLFSNKLDAMEFAKSHSPHPKNRAIVARTSNNLTDYKEGDSYIVAAFTAIEGTGAPNRDRYLSVRCNSEYLESLTERLVNTDPCRMYLGIEERMGYNALDIVKSINLREEG